MTASDPQPAVDDPGLYATDVKSLFDLDVISLGEELSVFSGRVRARGMGWPVLYGGQVAAQSLIAAGRTMPDDRRPHSLHGYFLRTGRTDQRIEFRVDHDRDGRNYSARHVTAVQEGRVIFSMLTSFTLGDPPPVLDQVRYRPERLRDPAECPAHGVDPHIEVRAITECRHIDGRELRPDMVWARVPEQLDDTPLMNAASLTYLSDLGSGFGQTEDAKVGVGGPSVDHAIWFHQPLDAQQWCVLDMWPVSAVSGRGIYHGSLRDRSGRLGATIAQENLLRDR
jgi:acyl-CoA thioesterase II